MSAPVPPFVPYAVVKKNFVRKFNTKGKAKNGLQNLLLRIGRKSSIPAGRCTCAADAIELGTDAALLEATIQKSRWRKVVARAGAEHESHKDDGNKSLILSTVSTVAVAVTAQYSLAGVAFRVAEPLPPGDLALGWQQAVHWCDACAQHRIRVEPHMIDNSDKHAVWNMLLDKLEREPGTVFIDELFVNLQKPEGEEECARDVRKLVTWVPAEAAAAAAAPVAHDAAQSHVLAPSAAWHERKFE
jgi:hypothetical protein